MMRCERPLPQGLGTCLLIHDFLGKVECAEIVAAAEQRGFEMADRNYPPSYRNNDRQVHDDDEQAVAWFDRLRGLVPAHMKVEESGETTNWELAGINGRLRTCRYLPGQRFGIHQDGIHHRGPGFRSLLTFMIYLTDGNEFEGGDTLFYANGPGGASGAGGANEVIARVRPRAGTLIVFDHRIWHAGDAVTKGVKHIVRSDLMYRRVGATDLGRRGRRWSGHEGYVWSLTRLSNGLIASGGRDALIRLWNPDGSPVASLRGHTQSVLGLAEAAPGVLASVSRDRTLRFWDVETRNNSKTVVAHEAAALALASLDGGRLASAGADGSIAIWDLQGKALGTLNGHLGWVWSLARMGNRLLASASEDGFVRIWDIDTLRCIAELKGDHPLRSVDVLKLSSADEYCLAVGDIAGNIRIWRVSRNAFKPVSSFTGHAAAVRRVRWLSDATLVSCGEDNGLRVWRWQTQRCELEHIGQHFVTDALALSEDRLLSCGYGNEMNVHNVRMGADIAMA